MKKTVFTVLMALLSLSAFSQSSSGTWDVFTSTYTNNAHNITWKLLDNLTWVRRPILTEGTLLKVRNDDLHILVSLAVQDNVEQGDIWDSVSDFESPQMVEIKRLTAIQNGMTFIGTKAIKSSVCGIHAVNTRTEMKKYYPEHQATVYGIEVMYIFYKRGNLYSLTVTGLSVPEDVIEDFDRIAIDIYNGFSIK